MNKVDQTHPTHRQTQATFHHLEGYERQTQVIEDLNAGRRLFVSRLAQLIWLMFGFLEAVIGLRSGAQVDRR